MKTLIYIFLGGGAGSISRYLVGRYSAAHFWPGFPVGTLLANILASLLLGYVSVKSFSTGVSDQADELWKPLLAVGFCGGFSTFSTFSLESFKYFQSAQYSMAILHMGLNMLLCLMAIWGGVMLGK